MADSDIEKYIAKLPADIQHICRKLYLIAQAQMPEAHEIIYHGAICFTISPAKFSPYVYIAPQEKWVNLGFFFGAGLPDPKKILVGKGVRMRHIKVRNEMEADNPAIQGILKAAWKRSPDIAELYFTKKKKKQDK
jgi:hypothetical protein